MNLSDITILNIKSADYRCISKGISKMLKYLCKMLSAKCLFDRKNRNIIKHKNLLSRIKMGKKSLAKLKLKRK